MIDHKAIQGAKVMLLSVLAGGIVVSSALAQLPPPSSRTDQAATAASRSRYRPNRLPKREKNYYELVWGVDSFAAKYVESGEIIRFTYHVLDADKARLLNEKKAEPFLIDPQAGVKLVIPSLENIGLLRQTGTPEAGKSYWMVFSNKGRLVRPGHRVSVAIGSFRVDGLMVQ